MVYLTDLGNFQEILVFTGKIYYNIDDNRKRRIE